MRDQVLTVEKNAPPSDFKDLIGNLKFSSLHRLLCYTSFNPKGGSMGAVMFENQLFDHWLNKKSQDILSKMDKEQVTTEDMLILTLKAQTNHFHHMDVEFREEFKKIDQSFDKFEQRFDQMESKSDQRFDQMETKSDRKFERMYTTMMWGFGILITSIFGLYLKDFFR